MHSPKLLLRIAGGLLLSVVPLCALVDRDGDGVSDIWAALYSEAGISSADPDGDRAPNRDEAAAGTDPLDPASRLAVTAAFDAAGRFVVRWPSVAGKRYRLERSADLATWIALEDSYDGTGGALAVPVTEAGVPLPERQFWRAVVSDLDSDGDGLNDWEELQLGTDPQRRDTDGDGLDDNLELENNADPLRWSSANDGLPDGWKVAHGYAPADSSIAAQDSDGDGRSNLEEYQVGSDPGDFFNGETPSLQVESGSGQLPVSGFLPMPIVVEVRHADGRPWAKAPLVFAVDFGSGQWAQTATERPTSSLPLRAGEDGRSAALFYFNGFDSVKSAGDIASVPAGAALRVGSVRFLPVAAPVGTWDLWYEDFEVESRQVEVEDGLIGFAELASIPYPAGSGRPGYGLQFRRFRRQEQHFRCWVDGDLGYIHDDQRIAVHVNDDGWCSVSGATTYAEENRSGGYTLSGKGTLQPRMQVDGRPRSEVTINDSRTGTSSGIVTLSPVPQSTPYGSFCSEAKYRELQSIFPTPPTDWRADHAMFGTGGLTFEISLSEEDTVAALLARFAQAKAMADAIAELPMGTWRYLENGGAIVTEDRTWGYPGCWLPHLDDSGWFVPSAEYGRFEFRVRLPEDSTSRILGADLRARFITLFYPADDPDGTPIPVDSFECVLNEDNDWQSPVSSITPEPGGYTEVQPLSMIAESPAPRRLLPGWADATSAVPADFVGARPEFGEEPVLPDLVGDGPWRSVLKNSRTLQPVFLHDEYSFRNNRDLEFSATWSVVPGATAQMRLWRWRRDGSALGVWSALPPGADLTPFYGSMEDLLFLEAVTPGTAVARFTVTIGDLTVADDIRVDAALPPPQIAVDANRDGQIKLAAEDDSDATSTDKPFRFWINDDIDRVHSFKDSAGDTMADIMETEEDDIGSAEAQESRFSADMWTDNKADSLRDLEDFNRIWISTRGLNAAFKSGDLYLGLKWTDVSAGNPGIRIYQQHDTTGSLSYLTDETEGTAQLGVYAVRDARYESDDPGLSIHTIVRGTDVFVLPSSLFANLTESSPKTCLLFEGLEAGKGQLKLVILKKDGTNYTEIGEGPSVWMELKTIGDMYEHWSVGNDSGGEPLSVAGRVAAEKWGSTVFRYDESSPEEQKYILMVHGWNMEKWEKERYAETAYKRWYWQGYKGRFGLFSWPCTNGFGDNPYTWPKARKAQSGITGVLDGTNFDRGEWTAWRSGAPLRQLLQALAGAYKGELYVFSHSMGGIVVSEALRMRSQSGGDPIAKVYVASQAALSAHLFDGTLSTTYVAGDPANTALQFDYDALFLGLGVRNYGPQTPNNIYPDWFAYLRAGGDGGTAAVSRVVNFYNANDWALSAAVWQFNQLTKPDWSDRLNGQPYEYAWLQNENFPLGKFQRKEWFPSVTDLEIGTRTDPKDRYEIMAFAAESRVKAFGATANISQGITGTVNLQSVWGSDPEGGDHKAHKWHSGQFRSTIHRQRNYWKTLLSVQGFDITTSATLP